MKTHVTWLTTFNPHCINVSSNMYTAGKMAKYSKVEHLILNKCYKVTNTQIVNCSKTFKVMYMTRHAVHGPVEKKRRRNSES